MTEGLTTVDIADVDLYDGHGGDSTDGIVKGYGGVGVCACVEHYTIEAFTPCLVQTVDKVALMIRLEIGNVYP